MALKMGFDEVILCGVPIEENIGYANLPAWTGQDIKRNLWNGRGSSVRTYQDRIRGLKDGYMGKVFSLAGFTREMFGEPSWQ